jgi:hypothetical protein
MLALFAASVAGAALQGAGRVYYQSLVAFGCCMVVHVLRGRSRRHGSWQLFTCTICALHILKMMSAGGVGRFSRHQQWRYDVNASAQDARA